MNNKTKLIASIHSHTCHSRFDGIANVEDFVHRIFEYGGLAFFMSDHGTLTGFEDLREAINNYRNTINCCKTKNCENCQFGKSCDFIAENCVMKKYAEVYVTSNTTIKGIPCTEAYFADDSLFVKRAHLLLIPKDNEGFTALSKAVTEASNAENLDSQGFPLMSMETLKKFFGPGTSGHGHIIATSACEGGVLSAVFLANSLISEKIEKLKVKFDTLNSPCDEAYTSLKTNLENVENEIASITEEIKRMDKLAKAPFKKKINAVEKLKGTEDYAKLKEALDKEMQESEDAKTTAVELRAKKDAKNKEKKTIKESLKPFEKDIEKWYSLSEQILNLENSASTDEELYEQAKNMASIFVEIFGNGNFYAELQNHRREQEKVAMPLVARLANELNLPVVAANDAHMVGNSESEIKRRQIMRSLRFNKWEEISESDKELYIKTDEELSAILKEIIPADIVEKAMQGIADITNICNVEYEPATHFPKFVSPNGESADEALRRMAEEGIEWRFPNRKGWTDEHEARMNYELDVISKMGYSDYHCIVADFMNYGRLIGKIDLNSEKFLANPFDIENIKKLASTEVGAGVGPGRGSAVGSLVCYLSGITSVNPMDYGLIFERFLNVERVSMPDIDSDFAPEVRGWCLEYVKHLYGAESVCCIMTRHTQQAKAAIRNCARLLGSELYDDKGAYLELGDKIAKSIPNVLGIKLSECEDILIEKFKDDKAALTIIENAKLVEGMFTHIGMHAAGVIIADRNPVDDYVPLMYIPGKQQMATQCYKEQCEARGLLKMDFLGLRNLAIITKCLKVIQAKYGKNVEIENIPFEKDVFAKIFAEGNTNSIFQFESSGMKQMLRSFKPSSIEDIILLVAAYRPGPMQYLEEIIAVKHGQRQPEYIIPEMEEILGSTYGKPIYQEQIMQIFNKFAGFSLGESDIIRRYMSKKKTDKFMAYKEKFIEGMIERGGSPEAVETFWNELLDFSKYAFNKSHAAAYAFVAYYTAWLKHNYAKEYMCSVMNYTPFDKINALIGDCRMFNLTVETPDINRSEVGFITTEKGVLYGLSNIKTVGNSAAEIIEERTKNGAFTSFEDFYFRTRPSIDVAKALILSGAFDKLHSSRSFLLNHIIPYSECIKKIKEFEKKIADATTEEKKAQFEEKLNDTKKQMIETSIPFVADETLTKLLDEKEFIGSFVSAHPIDNYPSPEQIGCTSIARLAVKKQAVDMMGIITDLRIVARKSDNKPMAFFTLEDKTGSIDVACFADTYEDYNSFISEDAVVKITGLVKEEETDDEENSEVVLKVISQKFAKISPKEAPIIIKVASISEWEEKNLIIKEKASDDSGDELLIYFEDMAQLRKAVYKVNRKKMKDLGF